MAEDTITRAHLAEAVYQEVGLSRNESAELVEAVLNEMSAALTRSETVKISSFGSFFVRLKGRRYYRPEDVELLRQIRRLLYHEGYTIKGVQRLMREGSLKERVDALEADTIDLSHLGAAERRKREIESAILQLTSLRERLMALLEP